MRRAIRPGWWILAAASLALLLAAVGAACSGGVQEVPRGTMTIVLIDKSVSAAADQELYRTALGHLLGGVGPGDRFAFGLITEASGRDLRAMKDFTLPAKVAAAGWTDEPLRVAKAQQVQQTAYDAMAKEMKVAADALLAQPARAGRSSIFESLRTIASLLRAEQDRDRRLIVLSDMVEDSEVANFEGRVLAKGFAAAEIRRQKEAGIIPDLRGTSVCVAGALASPPARAAALERFWTEYLQAAGAELGAGYYGRVLGRCGL